MKTGTGIIQSSLMLALCGAFTATATAGQQILVGPRAGAAEAAIQNAFKAHGAREVGKVRALDVRILELPEQANAQAVLRALQANPSIQFAEIDSLLPPHATLNDPSIGSQWHIAKMGAPSAWDSSNGAGVVIAILDTGVDGTHPDLAARMVPGWNMYDNNADSSDVYGHGTLVAGTAAAVGNNATGVAGLAWNAFIMPVRISKPDGYASFSTIASGLTWAADHGAKVANISYGVSGNYTVQSAAQYLKDKGGVTVVSAGNSGVLDATAPSSTMVTVSATNINDSVTSWSTYGDFVDVSAPGEGIYTTASGGGYASVSGTSFASPATAGTVALMMAANAALDPATLESLLKQTALDLGTAGFDQKYGHGRVNAAAAVQAAVGAESRDTQAPSVAIINPKSGNNVKGLVDVDASASDNVGVARVDLMVDGKLVASDSNSPYGFSWDSGLVADGQHSMMAYAYDAAGNYSASSSLNITVGNTADTLAPAVSISSPGNGSSVGRNVTIKASASDNVGVAKMSVLIDGVLRASVNGASITYKWNTSKETKGSHSIAVTAEDAAGNSSSQTIQVNK